MALSRNKAQFSSPGRLARLVETISALAGFKYALFAFLLGAFTALAFAPVHFFPAFFIAVPVLLLMLSRTEGKWQAFRLGWLFGFGHFLAGLYWIAESFYVQTAVPGWAGPIAVILLTATFALYPALALLVTRIFWRPGLSGILLFTLMWLAAEWLRGHLFTGFPWNLSAYIWTFSDAMMQPAALTGSYGYSLLTIWLAAAPALFFFRPANGPGIRLSVAAPFILFGLIFLFGLWRLPGGVLENTGLKVRIVQANIAQVDKWDPEKRPQNFAKYLTMSGEGLEDWRPDIIIWPEAAVPYALKTDRNARAAIAGVTPPSGLLITGAPRLARNGDNISLWNSLFVLDSAGEIKASYDKTHLVPFGEYLPLRRLLNKLGIDKLAAGAVDFSPGPGLVTLEGLGIPAFSPLICYEVIFPGNVVAPAAPRPSWLLNMTNDAWFGSSSGPYQHFAQSRMRAVEEGLPLVRSAGTGISAMIDPYGRVVSDLGLNKTGILDAYLPQPLSVRPLYVKFGDAILLIIVLTFGSLFLITVRREP